MSAVTVDRETYLRDVKTFERRVRLCQIFLVVGALLLWEISGRIGAVDPFIVSSPVRMIKMFFTMLKSDLPKHIVCTLWETVTGFAVGVAIGFFMSVALWYSQFANRVFQPVLAVLNSLPKIALGPVIIVWAGAGSGAIITMAVAISLIVTVMELTQGFYSTSENLIITVQSFGADRWQLFSKVVLPYNIPVLFQSLKVNIGLSLVGVIAGEFLVSRAGLGYLIVYAGQVFKMDLVMMSVVLLGVMAFLMYSAVSLLEKLAIKMINH